MVGWELSFGRKARKDASRLEAAGLKSKADEILERLRENPYYFPPRFEKLTGDLAGFYSRRINLQHRIVYETKPAANEIIVLMMYSHYGE